VGLVLSKPVPLPRSIFENLALAPRMAGRKDRREMEELVERSLKAARLWDEVKDRLRTPALNLSGGPAAAALPGPDPGHGARGHPFG